MAKDRKILDSALANLKKKTGMSGMEISVKKDTAIQLQNGHQKFQFKIILKNEIRTNHIPLLQQNMGSELSQWIVVGRYITTTCKDLMRERHMNYLEATGNCNIHQKSLHVLIHDKTKSQGKPDYTAKVWGASGLKLIFYLLSHEIGLNSTHRQIAKESGIALGSVGSLLQDLEKEKFISKTSTGYFLQHKDRLLSLWVDHFYSRLRPKLVQGKFRFASEKTIHDWKKLPTNHSLWGGEPAGAILTGALHPQVFTLYSELSILELIKSLRLKPDPQGEVEILKPFWKLSEKPPAKNYPNGLVPPLLVYADLKSSLDSRNQIIAEQVKGIYRLGET